MQPAIPDVLCLREGFMAILTSRRAVASTVASNVTRAIYVRFTGLNFRRECMNAVSC